MYLYFLIAVTLLACLFVLWFLRAEKEWRRQAEPDSYSPAKILNATSQENERYEAAIQKNRDWSNNWKNTVYQCRFRNCAVVVTLVAFVLNLWNSYLLSK